MKVYFSVSCLATFVQKSLFGLGIYEYIVVTKSRTIAFRTSGVNRLLLSVSSSALMASITVGLHVSGIANFRACVDGAEEATDAVS